jgi:hypothetical protein
VIIEARRGELQLNCFMAEINFLFDFKGVALPHAISVSEAR